MMIKPTMPNMPNIPGLGAVSDTLDFVKNLWGGMGLPGMGMPGMGMPGMGMPGMGMPGMPSIPGMVMPTLSVEELNKKITDLKAVESWLVLNMNMLRATIQALEVQVATISTLQTMGETFTATMTSSVKEMSGEHEATAAGNGSGSNNGSRSAEKTGALEPTSKDESDAANLTAPLVNAAAWWNMLQDQFKLAVSGAMPIEPPAAAKKEKPKAKPAAPSATATSTARKRKTTK